jgi:NAD(H)-dependent 7alpha-hydroxy-3-oxo-delta4-cholenoic acid oxidoreductase
MEMSGEVGGQVRYAAKAPGRADLILAVKSLEAEIHRLEVEIRLWTLADPETIRQLTPDEIVLATGAMASSSGIPGEETADLLDPLDAMANGWDGNGRALVYGGLMRGCSVAGRLAEMGGEVVLVEPGDEWIADLGPRARGPMLKTLLSLGNLKLHLRASLERIDVSEALLREKNGKDTLVTDIRFIVPTRTMLSQTDLHESLAAEMPDLPVRTVGDSRRPRGVFEAIQEGAAAARQI